MTASQIADGEAEAESAHKSEMNSLCLHASNFRPAPTVRVWYCGAEEERKSSQSRKIVSSAAAMVRGEQRRRQKKSFSSSSSFTPLVSKARTHFLPPLGAVPPWQRHNGARPSRQPSFRWSSRVRVEWKNTEKLRQRFVCVGFCVHAKCTRTWVSAADGGQSVSSGKW